MSQIKNWRGLSEGETAWEGFNPGDVIIQAICPNCDHGLLYRPARFCGRCHGAGLITVRTEHKHRLEFSHRADEQLYDFNGVKQDHTTELYIWRCEYCKDILATPVDFFWIRRG